MRRTKEEAEQTRRRIMKAALQVFNRHGIARATLEKVAEAAGVSRGAIYWHFDGKAALLRAIRDDVSLPLMDRSDFMVLNQARKNPLDCIEQFLIDMLNALERDRRTRLAFSVMSFKCEYVGELERELKAHASRIQRLSGALARSYAEARRGGVLRDDVKPQVAARGTIAFLVGLMRLWLLDDARIGIRKISRALVKAHVDNYRCAPSSGERKRRSSRLSRSG